MPLQLSVTRLSVTLLGALLGACAVTDNSSQFYGWCPDAASLACKRRIMIEACTATANSYPYFRDRLIYDEYGALFSENATFQIEGGPVTTGRAQIVRALQERGPAATMRHVSRVVKMEAVDTSRAKGLSYVTIWRLDNSAMEAGSIAVSEPWVVGEYHDDFSMQGGQCLIDKRLVKIVFKGATNTSPQ